MGKMPFSFLSPHRIEEREGALSAGVDPTPGGTVAAGDGDKRQRKSRGFDSPSYLETGWSVEAARLRRAASGSGTRGGGVGEQGGALVVAEVAVGRRSGAGGLFIGRMRRWSGAGQVAG